MYAKIALTLAIVLAPLSANAQSGVFSNLSRGDAVFISKAPQMPLATPTVRLDSVCEEDEGAGLSQQMSDALHAIGVGVSASAPVVLRYEIAPCETEFGRTQSLAQRDAYEGTSRASEYLPSPSQLKVPLGQNKNSGSRLTMNLLVYKPGQPPLWNALVAARAPGQETQDYFAQMIAFALQHWGDGGTFEFEILEPGQSAAP